MPNELLEEKKSIQFILFDLDGTLIDTELAAAKTVEEAFLEWKIPLQTADAAYLTGRTWESALDYLFKKHPIPIPIDQAKEHLLNRYRLALENDLKIVPGCVQAVRVLSKRFQLAVVSGSGRREIIWALKKLQIDSHFQFILGAEDYPRSKPHPDGYLKAIEIFKTSPRSCLVFEDSHAGITSALDAGAWVVAVTCTNHFQQKTHEAHFKIHDLTEITEKWIDQLNI
jgi:HAD superfamily hydrolase (TIGR01509 family)